MDAHQSRIQVIVIIINKELDVLWMFLYKQFLVTMTPKKQSYCALKCIFYYVNFASANEDLWHTQPLINCLCNLPFTNFLEEHFNSFIELQIFLSEEAKRNEKARKWNKV